MPTVDFYFEKKQVDVGDNANLRGVALAHDIEVYEGPFKFTNCRGLGLCGTCVVEILEGMQHLTPRTKAETSKLKGLPGTFRLACQCRVRGNVSVILKPKA
ncbi:MAG: (2Fe-2S)-binding protein [Verrucomicrobiae bacterium]|nr:(2Fe-2S)-binding protein [Verrucomicrobiae bacterium]